MLGVKKVGADRATDEMRDGLRQQQGLPAEKVEQACGDGDVRDQRHGAIRMFARVIEKRVQAHPIEEHENVAEKNGQWMADKEVGQALSA